MKLISIITKHLPLVTAAILMAACASEDFVGNKELHEANENGRPVSFDLVAAPQTRAVYGREAAELLNNNFVVWGDKVVDGSTQTVFNNYQVNYTANTANTTTTNSAGWEYIGCNNVPGGVTTNEGVTAFSESGSNTGGVYQTVKYWDFSATQYNFFAYSLGKGVEVTPATDPKTYTYAKASAMTSSGYTLSGSGDQLKASYISNKKTITPSGSSGTQVELQFCNFASNVRMAFYETVPGYSVKNLQFYPSASGSAGDIPYLYAGSEALPTQGTYTVSFDNTGKAELSAPTSATNTSNLAFGTALTYTASKEYREPQAEGTTPYIGRSSDTATPTTAVTVLPNPSGTDLQMKVDYTLVSRDESQEVIQVTGATAAVPAVYAQWKPNYSYTYVFKITDATLDPITLDAVVNVDADGKQETITTVTEPEPTITTYQKGSDYATTDGYNAGVPIYIVVYNGAEVVTLTDVAKLYIASVTLEDDATANVTEESVADAIATPEGAKDANNNPMTMTEVTSGSDMLSLTNEIPEDDSPDGDARNFGEGEEKVAKFTPTAPVAPETTKYYVFQYMKKAAESESPAEYQYKVIKVKAATP